MIPILISLLITLISAGIEFYFSLPVINIHSASFWTFILVQIAVFTIILFILSTIVFRKAKVNKMILTIPAILFCALLVIALLGGLFSSPIFHSKKYSSRIQIEKGQFDKDVPALKDISKIPLMDTASAKILGNRTIGSLSNVVSQYDVSKSYTTICYNNSVMKVAPLEYAGFFKYESNKKSGIPGYVLVNPTTNEAKYVKLTKGIKYSPSGYFGGSLQRKIRFDYPTKIIESYNFQIDDKGEPYWIVTCSKAGTFLGCYSPNEVIILNAVSGKSKIYDLKKAPEWIDMAYTGNTVEYLYNSYGTLKNGFFNSLFSQKGCTQTTDDYGFVIKNDDVYIYTGVTSTVSDKSNLGFILVNSRTGDYKYYKCAGAEENSAMSAAQGVVQNYGYKASFPALINIGKEPAYAMVLKDGSGLVKMYAMVNVKNYTIVATGETLTQTLSNYQSALNNAGKNIDIDTIESDTKTVELSIKDIKFLNSDNKTFCYIKDDNNNCYKQDFSKNEKLVLLNVGDTVSITYGKDDKDTIKTITKITIKK